MRAAEGESRDLQAAIGALTTDDAARILAEARSEAHAQVRQVVTQAFVRSLTEAIVRELGEGDSRITVGGIVQSAAERPTIHQAEAPPGLAAEPPETREVRTATGRQAEEDGSAEPAAGAHDAVVPAPSAHDAVVPAPSAHATYVYGVIWSEDAALVRRISGLDEDARVATVVEGRLAAVSSPVPLAEFEEQELRKRLEDINWVERVARAHETVLDEILNQTVVIPMRMCTVYRSEGSVRSMLRREEVSLTAALELLEDKLEWGVKVLSSAGHADRSGGADSRAAAEDARAATSGTDYLSRRRAQRDDREEVDRVLTDAAAEIHESLGAISHAALLNPTRPAEGPDGMREMVLNGVYLVERDYAEDFHREVQVLQERFGDLGLELSETGPWPPYNFVPGDIGAAW